MLCLAQCQVHSGHLTCVCSIINNNFMDIIVIPKESHLTNIRVTPHVRCSSLKIMQPNREK